MDWSTVDPDKPIFTEGADGTRYEGWEGGPFVVIDPERRKVIHMADIAKPNAPDRIFSLLDEKNMLQRKEESKDVQED